MYIYIVEDVLKRYRVKIRNKMYYRIEFNNMDLLIRIKIKLQAKISSVAG